MCNMKLRARVLIAAVGLPALLYVLFHFRIVDLRSSAPEIRGRVIQRAKTRHMGDTLFLKENINQLPKENVIKLPKENNPIIQFTKDRVTQLPRKVPTVISKEKTNVLQNEKLTCKPTPVQPFTADFTSYDIDEKINFTLTGKRGIYQVNFPSENQINPEKVKGTKSKDEEMLTVIVLPHSHNDPGWLMTMDEYYRSYTNFILMTAVEKLTQYKDMTFIWAETCYFSTWWNSQNEQTRQKARNLIANGQLEIVTGGWVMPDEASTHYYAIIDQLIEGHQWLYENLKVKPRSNWAIDPFGHSGTVPYLWKLAGFDFMVTERVHQAVKDYLAHYKKLEFNWRQFWDSHGKHDMLCHTMPYVSYFTNENCGPDPNVCAQFDFAYSSPIRSNLPDDDPGFVAMATSLYSQFRKKAKAFKYNTIFMPTGGDFRWSQPREWDAHYTSFTKLFKYMNSRPDWKINAKFGTLRDYFKAFSKSQKQKETKSQSEGKLPIFSGDFFPYSERDHEYWTGYFTTRPRNKFLGREVEAALRTADLLMFLACTRSPDKTVLQSTCKTHNTRLHTARRHLGLFLHHDAITGTAKPRVVEDYELKLMEAFKIISTLTEWATPTILSKNDSISDRMLLTKSQPLATTRWEKPKASVFIRPGENNNLAVFNPLPIERKEIITVRIGTAKISVSKAGGSISAQILPVFDSQNEVSHEVFDLTFPVTLPPMGFDTYTLLTTSRNNQKAQVSDVFANKPPESLLQSAFKAKTLTNTDDFYLENSCLKLTFSGKTGLLTKLLDKKSGQETALEVDFVKYKPVRSGAYVFGPEGEAETLINTQPSKTTVIRGSLTSSVNIAYLHFQHTVRLYNSTGPQCRCVYVENLATLGKASELELAMRFKSDLKSNGKFFADGNGLQMVERIRRTNLKIEANFYPMTTTAFIQDRTRRLTLHSFQPLGVSSLHDGWLEAMLDRTMSRDDTKGMGEGVYNNPPAPSKFYLTLERVASNVTSSHEYVYPTLNSFGINDMLQNPVTALAYQTIQNQSYNSAFYGIASSLPCDFHLISLRHLNPESAPTLGSAMIIHRRAHQCSAEHSSLNCASDWTQFSVQNIFEHVKPLTASEWTLSYLDKLGNIPIADKINLDAMDIKSFHLRWS